MTTIEADTVRHSFTPDHLVRVRIVAPGADVSIHHDVPPNRVELEVSADTGPDLVAEESDGELSITVPAGPDGVRGTGFTEQFGPHSIGIGSIVDADVAVHLPTGIDLDVETGTGDVCVRGTSGHVRVKTTGGDVQLGDCAGGDIETGTGDVQIHAVAGELVVRATGGDIYVARLAKGGADVRTGTGDITIGAVRSVPLWHEVDTGLGDASIELSHRGQPHGDEPHLVIRAKTTSGDVTLVDA